MIRFEVRDMRTLEPIPNLTLKISNPAPIPNLMPQSTALSVIPSVDEISTDNNGFASIVLRKSGGKNSKKTLGFEPAMLCPLCVEPKNGRFSAKWTLNFSQQEFNDKITKKQVVLIDPERTTWNSTSRKPLHQFIAMEILEGNSQDNRPLNLLILVPGVCHQSGYWDDMPSKLNKLLSNNYRIVEVTYIQDDDITKSAYNLSKALEYLKKNRYGANPAVVTHSMGGLVTRAYIQGLAVDKNNIPILYGDDIGGLLMISPPNFGSELAARFASGRLKDLVINLIGTYLLKQNRKAPAYQDMSPGSNFLWNLNYGFKGMPVDVKPWVIAGNQQITINGFHLLHCESDIGQHDGTVAISSASLWGAHPPAPISIVELNHLDQIKSSTNLIQEYLLKGSLQMAKFDQFPFGALMVKVKRDYTGKVFLKRVSDGNILELKRNKQSGIYYHLSVPAKKYLIHRDGDREAKEIEIESLKATLVEY